MWTLQEYWKCSIMHFFKYLPESSSDISYPLSHQHTHATYHTVLHRPPSWQWKGSVLSISQQLWWSVTVSQVQPPSSQALKQAVSLECRLSIVIPLHLSIALAAASAHMCTRVSVEANAPQRLKESIKKKKPDRKQSHVAETYCTLKVQADPPQHMHVHNPQYASVCWQSSGLAKKCRLTKNWSHCDQSTDIYSLLARSSSDAYSWVCVLQLGVKVW